jgi:hypothetical protein
LPSIGQRAKSTAKTPAQTPALSSHSHQFGVGASAKFSGGLSKIVVYVAVNGDITVYIADTSNHVVVGGTLVNWNGMSSSIATVRLSTYRAAGKPGFSGNVVGKTPTFKTFNLTSNAQIFSSWG